MYSCLPSSCCNAFVAFLQKSVANLLWQPLTGPCGSTGCSSCVCSKSGVIYICEMSLSTGVTSMKINPWNSYSRWGFWVLHSLLLVSGGGWASEEFGVTWSCSSSPEQSESPWSKPVVMVTDAVWLCLFFCSPRVLALIHLVSQRQGRKKDFQSAEWDPAMQSLRDDVYLESWVAVKSLFQRCGASEGRGCLASVNDMRCLNENQELLRGRTKQRLSILGCVHHWTLEICDIAISWLRPPIWSAHGDPGLVARAGSPVPCCRAEGFSGGTLPHRFDLPSIVQDTKNAEGCVYLTCQGALPLAPPRVRKG